jgi:hypothetical protein
MASICEITNLSNYGTQGIVVRASWPGGPLRQWAPVRPSKSWGIPHAGGGFVNQYVCGTCAEVTVGVYRVQFPVRNRAGVDFKWVCGGCRTAVRTAKRHLATHVEPAELSAVCQ